MSLNLGLQAGSFTRQLFTQDEIRLNVALYRRRLPKRRDQQAAKFSKGVEGEASVPNSFREKLKSNPAYQRLKQSTWQHNYKPSGPETDPGPIPEHLLEDKGAAASRRIQGSITEHIEAAEPLDSSGDQQQQASPSGRHDLPIVAPLPALSGRQSSGTRLSRVRFWLQFHAQFGQRVRIVGSHEKLGSWSIGQAAELEWSAGDRWSIVIDIPAGTIVEYKFVLLEGDGITAIAWQQGNNNVLAVGHADDNLEVFDTWESGPGSAVVAAGEHTTREGRMLSWAKEVETLFASQRNELRNSRMELLAAQDEARLAREEARQFRAELSASQAELTQAQLKVRELTVSNKMLKTQLDETNHSFRHALETTHKFLLEAENALIAQAKPSTASKDKSDEDKGGPSSGRGKRKPSVAKKPAVRRSRKTKKEQEGTEREAVEQAAGDKAAGELSQLNADRPSPEGLKAHFVGGSSNGSLASSSSELHSGVVMNGRHPTPLEQPV